MENQQTPQSNHALRNLFLIGIFIVVTTAVTYGAITVKSNIDRLKATKVSFGGIKPLGKNSKNQIGVQVTVNVQNNSDIDINVSGYKLDIYINNIYVAPVISKTKQVIKASATSPFSFNVYFDPANLSGQGVTVSSILSSLADITNMKIRIDGYISAGILGINLDNVPVKLEEPITSLI